ncbi:MAG: ABC transporter ATP-binding protein [Bacteroidetes bacterium 47-18]|nr:MAG: ABC transporter ATP-binding protein [Bacteroidetes bacterium 47-18]
MLQLNNVSFSFGARQMLNEVNLQIGENERIGLVGPNGAGKSTLLRLIMGEYSVESGNIQKANDVSIGFFNQDLLSFATDNSILSVVMTAYEKAMEWQATIDTLTAELEGRPEDAALLDAYANALHEFEMAGGYEMEYKAAEILEGLGFSTTSLQQSYNTFSGGWRMRVLLAKMMLQQPDILMLDEPTNHLDLPSIEWLERYLQSYPGTVIIVSHDRYFLDRMVTRIIELFQQDLISYSGNYSFYEIEKATRMEFLEREYENQQKYIRQQERFIERFRAKASKAAQAQSALKKLDRLERIELPDADVPRININFVVDVQPGKIICDAKNISKAYGDNVILEQADFEIMRGDKIALVGANGKGKSTLMRIIADMEPFEGSRTGWHNVKESFYAQHQLESLNIENTILEEMLSSGTGKTELELRQLLGCFLFSGDDVFKKIRVLSGGEKARVALAKVIASKANFLMLDEPTNHLDMMSVELLIEALNKYQGTCMIISHDRYFVSRTANRYWTIDDHKVNMFNGPYEEWQEWNARKEEERKAQAQARKEEKSNKPAATAAPVSQRRESELKQLQKEYNKLQKQMERTEEQMQKLDADKTRLEEQMSDPALFADNQKFKSVEQEYQAILGRLQRLESETEGYLEQMMELEEKMS